MTSAQNGPTMPRDHARIQVSRWDDPDWCALSFQAQWLYDFLLSSPSLSWCGVVDWIPKRIVPKAKGLSKGSLEGFAEELADARFIMMDDETDEVLIRTYIRHDGIVKQPNVAAAAAAAWGKVLSPKLKHAVAVEVSRIPRGDFNRGALEKMAPIFDYMEGLGEGLPEPLPEGMPYSLSPFPFPLTPLKTSPSADASGAPSGEVELRKAANSEPGFDEWWALYPRKTAKATARKAWAKAVKQAGSPAPILEGLRCQLGTLRMQTTDPRGNFCPHPATWLNGGRWEDEPEPAPLQQRATTAWGNRPTGTDRARAVIEAGLRLQQQADEQRGITA